MGRRKFKEHGHRVTGKTAIKPILLDYIEADQLQSLSRFLQFALRGEGLMLVREYLSFRGVANGEAGYN